MNPTPLVYPGESGARRVVWLMRRWGLAYHVAVEVNQIISAHPRVRVTSGYRGRLHNAAVGGAPNSYHLLRLAVDLSGPPDDLAAARRHARRTGAVEVLDEGDHTHLAWPRR